MSHRHEVYSLILDLYRTGRKGLAVLIDPDKEAILPLEKIKQLKEMPPDFIFIGGSYFSKHVDLDGFIVRVKEECPAPVILFPGAPIQVSKFADAILFLILIGSRAPEYLWGYHFLVAPILKEWNMEVIPAGYIQCGNSGSFPVEFLAQFIPPSIHRPYLIRGLAITSELMGHRVIYLEGGSGSIFPIPPEIITEVRNAVEVPIIAGGGIKTPLQAEEVYRAGATIVVVGNALESNFNLLKDFLAVRDKFNR